ncbi:GGDEF domain-containing protein [Pseudoalteromonas piscicida]|uniref:diguanylate cyclase n=1 Tax=Pseudoalteromonas piscicida TaxID=43662 RepID=A0AAD0W425_PSEO7|nr:GGDEF domain-containing protein [Pseudoalteromonas piscicida]ASD66552.1 GGDEF domain-containing protein [Pseudoalteromonas piscicida]AXQ97476.1 GGDEF domain-containing protein [Pseudoalteromonas piscicida]AXR02734.1 GGDEF domain-containing protein [Pseudoalteromonas piscicida]
MENVHILTQRLPTRGDYLPFNSEQYSTQGGEHYARLVDKLQTTLDIEELLTIYAEHVARISKISGLQFHCSFGVFQMKDSDSQFPASTFDLELEKEHLGQLVYFSEFPFSEAIKAKLSKLHACLIYPMRNALMYNRVLQLATKDSLTGLYNRSQFTDNLDEKLERCRRQHRNFSLMLLDLDNFKQVNDVHGHKAGDEVLVEFSRILQTSTRATDSVFRFGGDEFAILIDDPAFTTNKVIAERIMEAVRKSSMLAKYTVTTSIGFTLASSHDTADNIFARSDSGLYRAKAAGRNCARAV